MANVKINDLVLAGAVSDSMQFETDTTGTVANKVTGQLISAKVLGIDLKFSPTLANAIQTTNVTVNGLNETTVVLTEPAANQFQLTAGTTDMLVQADCTVDQDLSTTADVAFNSVDLINQVNEFSTDGTLAGDSDLAVPTEKAVKTYVDTEILSGLDFQTDVFTPTLGQTAFVLSMAPASDSSIDVYLNGHWNAIRGVDFTQTGTTFTWLDPDGLSLLTTDEFVVKYLK